MYEKNIIPLLTGDYPDPTIAEFRGKFYMTHTAGRPLIWEPVDLKVGSIAPGCIYDRETGKQYLRIAAGGGIFHRRFKLEFTLQLC